MGESHTLGTARIFWQGAHEALRVAGRPLNSPLGKLHKEGLALLRSHGWREVGRNYCDESAPGFAFTTRKGADFPARGAGLPAVRQLPQRCTAVLDDKALMSDCLAAEGCSAITPRTWTDISAFVRQHSSGGGGAASGGGGRPAAAPEAAPAHAAPPLPQPQPQHAKQPQQPGLWFLKHRHGVKGQAVHPYTSLPALLAHLAAIPEGSRRNFLVQEGVEPPLLLHGGRKATLRAHVLVVLRHPDAGQQEQQRQQQEQEQEQQAPLRAYVHEDVIVQEHAKPLGVAAPPQGASSEASGSAPAAERGDAASEAGSRSSRQQPQRHEAAAGAGACPGQVPVAAVAATGGDAQCAARRAAAQAQADAAVHVSSRGRSHPKPYLLSQLPALLLQEQQQQEQQQQQQHDHRHPQDQQAEAAATGVAALQRELWEQVCGASAAAVAAAARQGLVPADADPAANLYQLFAFDFAAAAGAVATGGAAAAGAGAAGAAAAAAPPSAEQQPGQQQHVQLGNLPRPSPPARLLLLEANSYPAIASGTMAAVDRGVYTRLVGDLLRLVVLPALPPPPGEGGAAPLPVPGGFRRVL